MFRTALLTLALFASVATVAEAKPVHPTTKVWTDGDGVTHIEQAKAGVISLCQTGEAMDVTTDYKNITVKGGRMCRPDEKPSLVLDTSPSNCTMVSGTNNGTLVMNCMPD